MSFDDYDKYFYNDGNNDYDDDPDSLHRIMYRASTLIGRLKARQMHKGITKNNILAIHLATCSSTSAISGYLWQLIKGHIHNRADASLPV